MDPKPPILSPQVIAAIRLALGAIGNILVGRALVSPGTVATLTDPIFLEAIAGGIMAAVSAGYGIYSRRPHGIIKDANALSQVDAVIVKPKTAAEIKVAGIVPSVEEAAKVVPHRSHQPVPQP